jgi:hypothetical protein
MAIKNIIEENRIQTNKFVIDWQPGVGEITLISVGELEEELDSSELPDRTVRSGGRKKPIEFDVVQPAHHDDSGEVQAMEQWYVDCQDPVAADHLKIGTYTKFDQQGGPRRTISLDNCWLSKKVESESDLDNDGDMATITWTVRADAMI